MFLEGLKRKFDIFIGTKNIFNPKNKDILKNVFHENLFYEKIKEAYWKVKNLH
jgi:hypothetical protein